MFPWILYRKSDGQELVRGYAPDLDSVRVPNGFEDGTSDVMVVPADAVATVPTNFSLVRAYAAKIVKDAAELVRLKFITPGSAKAISYLEKRREAEAWLADNTYEPPILGYEAQMTGKAVAQVVGEVIAMRDFWILGERLVNGEEAAATKLIYAAPDGNFAAVADAMNVDWEAVTAQIAAMLPT